MLATDHVAIQNMGYLPSLQHLNIMGSTITDASLPNLALQFPNLTTLNLSCTKITTTIGLETLTNLKNLVLNRSSAQGISEKQPELFSNKQPGTVEHLTTLKQLEEFEASACELRVSSDVVTQWLHIRKVLLFYSATSGEELRKRVRGVLILG